MSSVSDERSTEPPSLLQQGLLPVAMKYIPLPTPLPAKKGEPIQLTATETFAPPCRRCLLDAEPGDIVTLLSYDPFPVDSVSPYRGTSPIFVHTNDCKAFTGSKLPDKQLRRLISVRAYDKDEMLVAAEVVEGKNFENVAGGMLADHKASFIMVHNAKPGCFAVRVERA